MVAQRIPFLDLVRIMAIGLVVFHHYGIVANRPPTVVGWISERCYVGVDLFFVLSGWLIGGQFLTRIGRAPGVMKFGHVARFWIRRWIRTLPNYFAVAGVMVALTDLSAQDLFLFATFLQNYIKPSAWMISWSLCVEEYFYLFLPFFVFILLKLRTGHALGVIVILAAISPLLRWLAFAHIHQPEENLLVVLTKTVFQTHVRTDGLAIGLLLAVTCHWSPAAWSWLERNKRMCAIIGAGLVLLHWNPFFGSEPHVWSYRCRTYYAVFDPLVTSFGIGLVFPWGMGRREWRPPGSVWLSNHVYAIYLTHPIVLVYAVRTFPHSYWLALAMSLALILIVAWILRTGIEQPFLRLHDRLLARFEGGVNVSRSTDRPAAEPT